MTHRSLNRRHFIASALAASAAAPFLSPLRSLHAQETRPGAAPRYRLDPLPYPADFLKPAIDRETMEIHHGRHHAGYVRNLNGAVEGLDVPANIEHLIADLKQVPERVRTSVRNNGGGHANHALFWSVMTAANQSGEPSAPLMRAFERHCGSFAKFRENFAAAATGRFGSGWAWLVVREDRSVTCTSTPNQDSPLMGPEFVDVPGIPLLGLDVWEHAYYIHYRNRRADYVSAFFDIINWAEVSRRYEATL